MTYPETIRYLESFIDYEKLSAYPYKKAFGLKRFKDFLKLIGDPQDYLRCVHIAGTKGKGSTCAFISYILRAAGYKVGLYTSPHLSDFRERIRILEAAGRLPPTAGSDFEGMISENELAEIAEDLKPAIEDYNAQSKYGHLSFFEVYTAIAFVYFKENKIDLAVLETGLGGRLDATNTVYSLVCAITPISYEHADKLGDTLAKIAGEKAGIIKSSPQSLPGRQAQPTVISAPQEYEAAEVIRGKCRETGVRLFEVGLDITYEKGKDSFGVKGVSGEYKDLKIRFQGEHQLMNAALAVGAVEALSYYGIKIEADFIRSGLYSSVWPGRCEIISQKPLVVLDGAQNAASARALKKTIEEGFKYNELILVIGISQDKDIKGVCNELRGLSNKIVITKSANPRAADPGIIRAFFSGKDVYITNDVRSARDKAFWLADEKDLILVCGSLFVVGEFRDDKNRY